MTEEKLREVYDKYYRLVMKAAYDVLKDFDDSQDVCQEVFHKLIQKWNKVSPEDYAGWLALLWSSIFVTLMANKIGGLQFGIYRNCQISSRVFHTAVAALPLTKANRSDFE